METMVAVTGASGRLGNVLVRALEQRGCTVRALVEPGVDSPPSLADTGAVRVPGSVTDRAAVDALVDGAAVVYHLAARVQLGPDRDGAIHAVNVGGTRHVMDACRRTGARLVHTSSHAALDRRPLSEPLDEGRPLALDNPCAYHRSKAEAEAGVLQASANGLDAVVVCPGTVVGPHDYGPSLIGRVMLDLYHGRVPALMEATSDYVDARDVAEGMIAAAQHGRRGERYLLTGEVLDIEGMASLLGTVTGRPMPRMVLPMWVGWALMPLENLHARVTRRDPLFTPGMLRSGVSNREVLHTKAARELGFAPRPARDAVTDAFAWFDAQGWLTS
ncbi:MAG: NAD-dependent epimerase/dehydratase family protein [Myxococcota bacterium]